MERSLFYIFVSLAASIIIGCYEIWWLFFLLLTGILLVLAFTSYSRPALYTIVILFTGVLLAGFSSDDIPENLPAEESFIVEGKIANYPQNEEGRGKFTIDTNCKNHYLSRIQVFTAFNSDVQKGDRIALKGSLKPPDPPGNPGQFNYPAYLKHEHIFYTLSVKEPEDIKILQPAQGMNKIVNSFRDQGISIVNTALPPQEAPILLGMLLGKVDSIDDEQYDNFQKTGIIHIFSVSGLHVGFVVLLCSWLSALFNLSKRNKFLFNVITIVLYGTLTGWPVSVVRASIMAVTCLTAYYFGRENQMLNSLGMAGIIILLFDPQALFKISFQLSFLATFGLVYIFPVLRTYFNQHHVFWDLILIPVSAQLAVLPLIAWYFNLFSPVSLISNIIVTYTAGASVILGIFTLILAPFLPGLATIISYPAGLFIEIIIHSNVLFKNLPLAYLWVATPKAMMIIAYYGGLVLLFYGLKENIDRKCFYTGLSMVLVFMVILCLPASVYNRGTTEFVFIDVGQGDSILMKTPEGKFILVDGGGSDFYDVASTRLMPYLHHRGIREVYMAINTHPDTDHLSGVVKTIKELRVVNIGLPQTISSVQEYKPLKELAAQKKSNVIELNQGQTIKVEKNFIIKVLHPEIGEGQRSDYNQESLALLIESMGITLLLTGDLHADQLEEMSKKKLLNSVNIIKVPHHGSRFSLSEAFYLQTDPQWAVISVGNNNFGHPHKEVIEFLEGRDIRILRTDQHGNTYFDSNGIVKTFK